MTTKKLLFLCIFLSSIFANAAELFPSSSPRQFSIADKLESDSTIGGYPIWQGEGKWRIFDLSVVDSSGRADPIPLGTARLFQTEGNKWVASMDVKANLRPGNGYWSGDPCKRNDMLFKIQMDGGKQDNCVTINHITHYMGNPSGKAAELYAMLKQQGIEYPPTVLAVQLTRNATSMQTLTYTLWINPELLGFARDSEPEWGRNTWNKTFSYSDPAKKQLVDALATWATKFGKQMDDGIARKQDAFTSIPSWRTVLDGTAKPDDSKSVIKLD